MTTRTGFLTCAAMLFPLAATAGVVQTGACKNGSLVAVVAHQDDDLLFINPLLTDAIRAGQCVTVVHVVGGYINDTFAAVLTRESAAKAAYERLTQTLGWTEAATTLAGHQFHRMALTNLPVVLVELRLPAGDVRAPGSDPLATLWDQKVSLTTYPLGATGGTATTSYNRAGLTSMLSAIMKNVSATQILTLNPDTLPYREHPDHIYAARAARAAAQTLLADLPVLYHTTYPTAGLPRDVPFASIQDKRDSLGAFFNIDGNDPGHAFQEYEWDGDWVARRYGVAATSHSGLPQYDGQPFRMVNDFSGRCMIDPGTAGAVLTVNGCTEAANNFWRWLPIKGVFAGQVGNAQLQAIASQLCVTQQGGVFSETKCNAQDMTQRWTPWDFGVVFAPAPGPSLGCMAEDANGNLSLIANCSDINTRSDTNARWSNTRTTNWADTRLDGAMYSDVTGTGANMAVYLLRIDGQSGFQVRVADPVGQTDTQWYYNGVPFNTQQTIIPSCPDGTLCFDSSRFLLADFDGDGKADLMVITPYQGGTGFWLMRSTGSSFAPPILWTQTSSVFQPDLAQQYVAGDFTGSGRVDLALIHQRGDSGFNIWVLANTGLGVSVPGSGASPPALWMQAPFFGPKTRFFAMQFAGSSTPGLIAADGVNNQLVLSQIASSGTGFSLTGTSVGLPNFDPAYCKMSVSDLDGDGTSDLVILYPRGDSANVNVWTIQGGQVLGAPALAATLPAATVNSWNEMIPSLISLNGQRTLALFGRTPQATDNQHWMAGGTHLFTAPIGLGSLGPIGTPLTLPWSYSETLRLDRKN